MISLFIDTSTEDVSIALIKDNVILSSVVESLPNQHSIYAVSYLDKILKSAIYMVKNAIKLIKYKFIIFKNQLEYIS